jgi:hypothetical protein
MILRNLLQMAGSWTNPPPLPTFTSGRAHPPASHLTAPAAAPSTADELNRIRNE